MLSALVGLGRPAAWNAAHVLPAALAREPASALISTATSALLRDGGHEASTSYGSVDQQPRAWARTSCSTTVAQRRSHASLADRLAAAPQRAPSPADTPAASAEPQPLPEAPTSSPASDSIASGDEAASPDPLAGLDMESLLSALLHPLPLGRSRNPALFNGAAAPAIEMNGSLFFDPAQTLSSTMRALTVIRQVLREDGHVLIVNPNPAMRPLLREAAHLCLNRNVWFWYRDWIPGAISDPKRGITQALNTHHCQPNRRLMAARGLQLRNPLCPTHATPVPKLPFEDMDRLILLSRPIRKDMLRREGRAALTSVLAARAAEARMLPAGTPSYASIGTKEQLTLVVSLDLSYGGDVVREAYERNIPAVSLLNGHSDASRVAFPVYASEAHAGFQHFFLDWLLRVVNVRTEAFSKR